MKKSIRQVFSIATAVLLCVGTAAVAGCTETSTPPGSDPYENDPPSRTVEQTKLVVYDGPQLLESSSKVSASVEDEDLFVYDTRVNHGRSFFWTARLETMTQVVSFDFEGKVHMKVEVNTTTGTFYDADKKKDVEREVEVVSVSDVVIRPLSYEIEPQVNGNVIEFDLQYSANYSLEYKANYKGDNDLLVSDTDDPGDNALQIFANPIETNPITAEEAAQNENIVYIGPGVYSAGAIPVKSNTTVYLAGGAYVFGQIRAENVENLTIRGRGMFSGSIYPRSSAVEYTLPIELRSCKNVTIEGISILDPAGWAVTLYKCDGVNIDNLKIITARSNGDGISVQSSKDVKVNGGYIRTWDDSLVVKNTDRGTTSNVVFDNVVVWTDLAQSCEVGFETNGATIDNVIFQNITIIHNYHKAAMSIHNCDDAAITNITYRNITLEDGQMLGDNRYDLVDDYLIDITIAYNLEWSKADHRGPVSKILFDNIKVLSLADSVVCRMNGESGAPVSDVTVSNVEIEGQRVTNRNELKLPEGQYVQNIKVEAGKNDITGAIVKLPYLLDLKGAEVNKEVVSSPAQNGLEVPDFSIPKGVGELYMGRKMEMEGLTASSAHGTGSGVSANLSTESFGDTANLIDGNRGTAFVANDWTKEQDEFVALTLDFNAPASPGVIRVYLGENNQFAYNFTVSVFAQGETQKKEKDENGKDVPVVDEEGNPVMVRDEKFKRAFDAMTYSASPSNGNYFDIVLKPGQIYYAIQLRFFRVDGVMGQQKLELNEISFFPNALTTNTAIVDSTPHNDVYRVDLINDGERSGVSYYESDRTMTNGAYVVFDLKNVYTIKYLLMCLPPIATWDARDQTIDILVSADNVDWSQDIRFTSITGGPQKYTFDPATGNLVGFDVENVRARYIKLVWSSNSSGYGAQLSEFYAFGE